MNFKLGRILPTTVALVVGMFILAGAFVAEWPGEIFGVSGLINQVSLLFISWVTIVAAFALFLGFANVISVHWGRIQTQKPGALYSIVLLIALAATLAIGFFSGGPNSDSTQFIFNFILQPLESTFFALLAIFIATASFRAFRVRNLETLIFVLFAVIVLLGQVPLGIYLWAELPVIKDWILNVPALAGVRGILLGVALGTIATGLRVLIGADRPYTDQK
ncbi:MAG: hypothetical protein KDI79_03370 [Anaerolineae bacterium]|nr:hypothetical protein [Anaerolineae bacterium]